MSESILTSTKKVLGIPEAETAFDLDIIMHINSALMMLSQIGVGPEEGLAITDDTTLWDRITQSNNMLNTVKSYVYLRVRLLFDPPATSFVLKAFEEQMREMEWRLNLYREYSAGSDIESLEDVLVIDGGQP